MLVIGVWQRRVKLSSIVVAGDTSGSVTLSAPAVAGSTVLTLPSVSGTLVSTGNAVSFSSVTAPILNSATTLSLQTNGTTTAVTIDASQNTGMGAVSLGARLQTNCVQSSTISSPFTTQPISLQNTDTTLNNYTSICNINSAGQANAAINFINIGQSAYPNNAGAIAFSTYAGSGAAGTEKARFSATGKFGVALDPNGNAGMIQAKAGVGIDTFGGYSSAGAFTFAVSGAGQIYAVSTSIAAISDERLKENIRDLDSGLADVMALKPRLYDWKEGKGADIKNARGFIAQEFEEVFPDLVSDWREPAPEGEEPYKSIRQDLIPTLVKAIQELKAIIDTQQIQITLLNAKVGI